jgi:RNA recognition motif-containing protein
MTNIFVGNLSFDATQSDLESAFGQFGAVDRVHIVTDRQSGQPRGFAFVEMSDRQSADAAIAQLNGTELRGRAMNVNEARPKPEGGGGGGFNRRPGGGPRRDGNRGSRW